MNAEHLRTEIKLENKMPRALTFPFKIGKRDTQPHRDTQVPISDPQKLFLTFSVIIPRKDTNSIQLHDISFNFYSLKILIFYEN